MGLFTFTCVVDSQEIYQRYLPRTYAPSRVDCLEIWEPKAPETLRAVSRPEMGLFTFTCVVDSQEIYQRYLPRTYV